MNPTTINDGRSFVWTVSQDIKDTYCIYLNSKLHAENLDFESFWKLYNQLRG